MFVRWVLPMRITIHERREVKVFVSYDYRDREVDVMPGERIESDGEWEIIGIETTPEAQ